MGLFNHEVIGYSARAEYVQKAEDLAMACADEYGDSISEIRSRWRINCGRQDDGAEVVVAEAMARGLTANYLHIVMISVVVEPERNDALLTKSSVNRWLISRCGEVGAGDL